MMSTRPYRPSYIRKKDYLNPRQLCGTPFGKILVTEKCIFTDALLAFFNQNERLLKEGIPVIAEEDAAASTDTS
jgi:hypothetical protein